MTQDKLSTGPTMIAEGKGRPSAPVVVARKTLVFSVLVGLGAIGVAYAVGRLQGTVAVSRVEAKAAHASQQQQSQADKLSSELASARQKILHLQALRQLHQALVALEQRNFGIAQQRVAEAGRLVGSSRPPVNSELARLSQAMLSKKLVATENLAAQRLELIAWAEKLDGLVGSKHP